MRATTAIGTIGLLLCSLVTTATAAQPAIDLELVTEGGFPLTGAQKWMTALKDLGFSSMRIRSAQAGDKTGVKNRGSERLPRYHVTGILTANDKLALPGGFTFTTRDKGGIRKWIERLQEGGVEGLTAQRGAFGLTSKHLVAVHKALSVRVTFSTKNQPVGKVVGQIVDSLPLDVTVSATARRALSSQETMLEEMQGMSGGTTLAAALRPLGLIAVPHKPRGGDVRLAITDVRSAPESWPIGWPSEKSPSKTLPKMFEFLNVEIEDFYLSDAMNALQKRLEVPFLYDHNSLARHDIEPTKLKVSMAKGRTFYKRVMSRLLSQARLKAELRVDENGKPFFWITTIRK